MRDPSDRATLVSMSLATRSSNGYTNSSPLLSAVSARALAGVEKLHEVGTVNYPNDFEYTRVTEFKYLTGQAHEGTSVVREFPKAEGEPSLPHPASRE